MDTVFLCFDKGDSQYYWMFLCTKGECKLLKDEVDIYNDWIEKLLCGDVPSTCLEYKDSETFKRDNQHLFKVSINEFSVIDDPKTVISLESEKDLNYTPYQELENTLTQPYDHADFKMGFKVLPVTKMLISRSRKKTSKHKNS